MHHELQELLTTAQRQRYETATVRSEGIESDLDRFERAREIFFSLDSISSKVAESDTLLLLESMNVVTRTVHASVWTPTLSYRYKTEPGWPKESIAVTIGGAPYSPVILSHIKRGEFTCISRMESLAVGSMLPASVVNVFRVIGSQIKTIDYYEFIEFEGCFE